MQEQKQMVQADAAGRFRQMQERFAEPAWLGDMRALAWRKVQQSALPSRVNKLWRYTDPGKFEPFMPVDLPQVRPLDFPAHVLDAFDAGELAATGVAGPCGSTDCRRSGEFDSSGATLMSLQEAAASEDQGGIVRRHLGRVVGFDHGRYEAYNLALWNGGIFLHIPRAVRLEKPIHVVFRSDEGYQAPRLLVVAEEGAEFTLIEEYLGGGSRESLGHSVSELVLSPQASVRYIISQRLGSKVRHHATQRLELAKDSRALTFFTSFGSKMAKMDAGARLEGPGADSRMFGFLFAEGRQQFDHHTLHEHAADHTTSNLDVKAVLTGHGRSAYTGSIIIDERAPYSEAYQENRNLLLSRDARAESIPELEISIDEVQCKHGATVGPVDPDQLFFLMSRAIPEDEAIRQIVGGFLEPTLGRLPGEMAEPLRMELAQRLVHLAQDSNAR